MKIYYVSHPYGGKQKNEAKADEIVRALQTEYPDICFVSPVHAIRCPYSKTDYIQGLDYCLELLRRCDGQRDCVDAILIWLNAESDDDTVDMIHHPNHYTWRGTEAIDIVRAMTRGSEGVEAYLLGCTVKYMYRFPKKNGAQDLDKAVQCLKMLREIRYGKPTK